MKHTLDKPQDQWISINDAATYLGIHPHHVRRLILIGELYATKTGGKDWETTLEWCNNYIKNWA